MSVWYLFQCCCIIRTKKFLFCCHKQWMFIILGTNFEQSSLEKGLICILYYEAQLTQHIIGDILETLKSGKTSSLCWFIANNSHAFLIKFKIMKYAERNSSRVINIQEYVFQINVCSYNHNQCSLKVISHVRLSFIN